MQSIQESSEEITMDGQDDLFDQTNINTLYATHDQKPAV